LLADQPIFSQVEVCATCASGIARKSCAPNRTNPSDHAAAACLAKTRRDRGPQFFQVGFEKVIGDDQRLDRLSRIAVASYDGLIGCGL